MSFSKPAHSSSAARDPISYFISLDNISYSEPTSVASIRKGFNRGFHAGNKAFSFNRLELGLEVNQWRWGFVSRFDYVAEFSSDAAELVYLSENKLSVELQKNYEIFIDIDHYRALGLMTGYQFQISPRLEINLNITSLYANRLLKWQILGEALAEDEKRYSGDINLDYLYTKDIFFDRPQSTTHGYGLAVDFGLIWAFKNDYSLAVDIKDLWGRIDWQHVDHTDFDIKPVDPVLDENGFLVTTATGTGLEDETRFIQKIMTKTTIGLSKNFAEKYQAYVSIFHTDLMSMTRYGLRYYHSPEQGLGVSYNWNHHAISVSYLTPRFKFSLQSDDVRLTRAQLFTLGFQFIFDGK